MKNTIVRIKYVNYSENVIIDSKEKELEMCEGIIKNDSEF